MSRRRRFLLCAFPALSTVALASGGETPAAAGSSPAAEPANERGVPALFSWGDVDGDGRLDLAAVSGEGQLQLLVNAGDGHFEDVTERAGLSAIGNAALALWADYDGDGRLDLFVGARAGASRLFHNEGGTFVDMSAGSGLASEGAVQSAQWFDHDGDGRLDLFVVTAEKNELDTKLFRGVEGGFFERTELPLAGVAPGLGGSPVEAGSVDTAKDGAGAPEAPSAPDLRGEEGGLRSGAPLAGSVSVHVANPSGGSVALAPPTSTTCLDSIKDQANPSTCLVASTTPTLGRLYPISANLFVAVGGNVGIGTTSPTAKLEVAGTARMTGTLTLNPSGDQALDVSTGSIYKGGALFIHTKGAFFNTALGREALASVTTGAGNTASGQRALFSDTTGGRNTASGYRALGANTSGSYNTASGYRALESNTTGLGNTGLGSEALRSNTTGNGNTAAGESALRSNTTGEGNTACGYLVLTTNTTGHRNTASGRQALRFNTTGFRNTASGYLALESNTTGHGNTASGNQALVSNTTGIRNTASGYRSLYSNTTSNFNTATGTQALRHSTGAGNIALGAYAGYGLTTGNDNIAIGSPGLAGEGATTRIGSVQTRAFIAGIRGVTTGNANAIPVLVDSNGQLGTVSSSRRFKKDIDDMGDLTERLLELRPVVFHYKQEQKLPNGGEVPLEYGLIAEEVAEIFPDLVVHDEEGLPFTVKYHLLSAMLLNEMKKQREQIEAQGSEHERERREMDELRSRLSALEARTFSAAVPENK